jgi:amino acid adenylation domain-containing protein/thioester reductase-like protein
MTAALPTIFTGVTELFEHQASCRPETVAVRCGDRFISYGDLNRNANQLAAYLKASGIGSGMVVALWMDRSVELVTCALAILKSRATYVPLDPAHNKQDRVQRVLERTRAAAVVSHSSLIGDVSEFGGFKVLIDRDGEAIANMPVDDPSASSRREGLAAVMFTSGTTTTLADRTGAQQRLKGVMLTHENLAHFVRAMAAAIDLAATDVYLHTASVSFVTSLRQLLVPLCCGASVVVATANEIRDPVALFQEMSRSAVTIFDTVPSYWKRCCSVLERMTADERARLLENQLRLIMTAGDALFGDVPIAWNAFNHRAKLINFWGQTETAGSASFFPYSPSDVERNEIVPIGKPLGSTRLLLLDSSLQPASANTVGEIYVASPSVAEGYLNDGETTSRRFIAEFSGSVGGKLYRTGDLGRCRADGVIEYVGRADDQLKINGFRLHPLDIESTLRGHPSVADVAVVSEQLDDGLVRLVAYIVPAEGASALSGPELRQFVEMTLPSYMVPAAFCFVPTLPRLVNGKLDRRSVPPVPSAPPPPVSGAESREAKILQVFRETLRNAALGAQEDFFQAGGDSLSAIEVMAALSEAFELRAPTELLFRNSSAAKLAAALDSIATPVKTGAAPANGRPHSANGARGLDLLSEVELPPSISASGCSAVRAGKPRTILLTGATGFFGVHLLGELLRETTAEVFCLVRASSIEAAHTKIADALRAQKLSLPAARNRIVPILGDLAAPELGLSATDWARVSSQVDTIVHCGAFVHYLYGYETLKGTNVSAALDLLKLASTTRLKHVLFVSSIGVLGSDNATSSSGEPVADPRRLGNGYLQSKWVADRIMSLAQTRLPVTVFRPGRITWSRATGKANPNDVLSRMLAACLALRMAPELDIMVPMSPVDDLSRLVVRRLDERPENEVINVPHLTGIRWKDLVRILRSQGHEMPSVDYSTWLRRVRNADASKQQMLGGLSLWLVEDAPPSLGWINRVESTPANLAASCGLPELLDEASARDICEVYLKEQTRSGLVSRPIQAPVAQILEER